jgi:TPR repeat protein
MMYYRGDGVPNNHIYALLWLMLASADGDDDYKKARDSVANVMTPYEIQEAQRLAYEWLEKRILSRRRKAR